MMRTRPNTRGAALLFALLAVVVLAAAAVVLQARSEDTIRRRKTDRLSLRIFAAGGLGGTPLLQLRTLGTTVNCQFWGRDPGFTAPDNTSLSDALQYVVGP